MKTFKTPKGTELPILDLRGKDYVQVAHRLVWFREEKPLWGIETEIISHDEKKSIFRASIKDEQGRVIAQATKQEDSAGFKDHLEKCETGAIGRALALIGYGTQFAPEFDEEERIVDSPIANVHGPKQAVNLAVVPTALSPGAYVVKCGKKYLGWTLERIGAHDAASYSDWLKSEAQAKGKPLTGDFLEAVNAIDSFVRTRDVRNK